MIRAAETWDDWNSPQPPTESDVEFDCEPPHRYRLRPMQTGDHRYYHTDRGDAEETRRRPAHGGGRWGPGWQLLLVAWVLAKLVSGSPPAPRKKKNIEYVMHNNTIIYIYICYVIYYI